LDLLAHCAGANLAALYVGRHPRHLNTIPSVVVEFAELFPNAEFVVQPGAGHFPWLDDADRFVATTATFLG
jgi:pimeloyl-ACP methyl ester carboxylesterase